MYTFVFICIIYRLKFYQSLISNELKVVKYFSKKKKKLYQGR